jgi:hypothetical protein
MPPGLIRWAGIVAKPSQVVRTEDCNVLVNWVNQRERDCGGAVRARLTCVLLPHGRSTKFVHVHESCVAAAPPTSDCGTCSNACAQTFRAAATAAVLDRRLAPNGAQGRDTCVCLDLVILDTPFDRHRLQASLPLRRYLLAAATIHSCARNMGAQLFAAFAAKSPAGFT